MLGISYGEIFLILGATAALIGPKDLPKIARTAGRLAGRAIGYVQLGRGQLENVLQQSQASQVHKELQDTMAQLEAIRHEIRSISMINPGPMTRRMDNMESKPASNGLSIDIQHEVSDMVSGESAKQGHGNVAPQRINVEHRPANFISEESSSTNSTATNMHSQASTYARLAELSSLETSGGDVEKLKEEIGLLSVLPVSAESAGLLPKSKGDAKGSDIMLEAILEAEVAQNAKHFFAQHQNELKGE